MYNKKTNPKGFVELNQKQINFFWKTIDIRKKTSDCALKKKIYKTKTWLILYNNNIPFKNYIKSLSIKNNIHT